VTASPSFRNQSLRRSTKQRQSRRHSEDRRRPDVVTGAASPTPPKARREVSTRPLGTHLDLATSATWRTRRSRPNLPSCSPRIAGQPGSSPRCLSRRAGLAPDTINPVREQPWRFRNYAFCSSAGGVTAVIANQQPNALREAAARRPTSASRRSACASSGRCSRSAARGETAECVARRLSSAATWPDRLELQSATFGTSRPSTTASAGIPLRNTLSPADYGQLGRSPLGG
jgi:hypothetical protein